MVKLSTMNAHYVARTSQNKIFKTHKSPTSRLINFSRLANKAIQLVVYQSARFLHFAWKAGGEENHF